MQSLFDTNNLNKQIKYYKKICLFVCTIFIIEVIKKHLFDNLIFK